MSRSPAGARRSQGAALLLWSLAGTVGAQAAQPVTEERVRAAFEEARVALAGVPGFALPADAKLVLTEAATIAARVEAENLPLVRRRESDPDKAADAARQIGEAFAQFAFAKYAWSTRELLVVPAQWNEHARLLERPQLTSDATLRAVLVHELVHAWDDVRTDLAGFLAPLASNDSVQAANSLVEGHAQFRARRVCEQQGWSSGFEAFTGSIGAVPASSAVLGEATLAFLRIQGATLASAYHDGERFVAALHASGGDELVARAFRAPPPDAETILHPQWYLDPATRPAVLHDPEPALDLFVARFPAEAWTANRVSLQSAQLAASLALLPEDTVRRVTGSLRAARAVSLQPSADPNAKMVVLVVLEFEGEVAARAFVTAGHELGELKDEKMRQGILRITASEREELDVPGLTGFRQRLAMVNGTLAFEVASVDAARGRLVVEALFSGEPIEDEELVELAGKLLDVVRRKEDGAPR